MIRAALREDELDSRERCSDKEGAKREVGNGTDEKDQGLRRAGNLQREGGMVFRMSQARHLPGVTLQGKGSLGKGWFQGERNE